MSHIISPSTSLCIHFAGLGQVSHNKWFVFWQFLISDWTFDDWIFMLFCQRLDFFKVSHVKVWILRTLTTMSGSVLSSGLDLSCLLVWICLVSWSWFVLSPGQLKQANFRSSGGQLDKETSNTSTAELGESLRTTTVPWNRESSPSILMSITPLSVKVWECCSSSIYLIYLSWNLGKTFFRMKIAENSS